MRLYLRLRAYVAVPAGSVLRLGQVADLVGDAGDLADLPVGSAPSPGRYRVLPLGDLLRAVTSAAPAADVQVLGERDVLVRGAPKVRRLGWALAAAAWLLLLVGATMTILNFHADVNMPAAHRELYRLLTGHTVAHPLLLEVPYALGVGIGVLLFFRPRGGEPGPLDLEAARYERSLHAYLRERR